MRARAVLAVLVLLGGAGLARAEDYLGREEFLALAFAGREPTQQTLWLGAESRARAEAALGLAPRSLRVRYWREGARTAWILEEIGKEQPITLGLAVEDGHLAELRVMAFRESRGWEIRHAFFTTQFVGVGMGADGRLDRSIDGITGATLSVRAVDRAARLALWLDAESRANVDAAAR